MKFAWWAVVLIWLIAANLSVIKLEHRVRQLEDLEIHNYHWLAVTRCELTTCACAQQEHCLTDNRGDGYGGLGEKK